MCTGSLRIKYITDIDAAYATDVEMDHGLYTDKEEKRLNSLKTHFKKNKNISRVDVIKKAATSMMLTVMMSVSFAAPTFADDISYISESSAAADASSDAQTTEISAVSDTLIAAETTDASLPSETAEKTDVSDDAVVSKDESEEPYGEDATMCGAGDGEDVNSVVNDIAVSPEGVVRTITILNPEPGVSSMRAAVWSDTGGQDDLNWYEMDRQTDGSFMVRTSVGDLRHSGTCYVHVYSGSKFINGRIFTVTAAEMSEFKLKVEESHGSRVIILPANYAGSNTGSGFRAAVWSDEGGQDDLAWHDMAEQTDGTWLVKVSAANFVHSGRCIVHVYSGSRFIDGNTFEITAKELAAYKLTIIGADGVRNIILPAGYSLTSLKAAVWSKEGGQDDLKWYDMAKNTDSSWSVQISADNMLHAGTCIVHVYSGSRFIDGNTFTISSDEVKTPELSVSGEEGTRTLVLTGGASDYSNLKAAVWSAAGGQDDIKWYDLAKKSDGTWAADISAAYLKHGGECYAHVYSGSTFVDGLAFNMTDEEVDSYSFKITGSGGTRFLTVGGAYTAISSLRVAVWSETGGQDDLKWYNASRQADGTWLADISVSVLLNGGTVNVHVYSGNTFQFAMTFELSDAEFAAAVQPNIHAYAQNILNATGGTLRGAYNWAVNNIKYQSLVIPLTVPKTGKYAGFTRQELYFIYAYEKHLGDCFCFAATVFWCAKELGYNARLMEGMCCIGTNGEPVPHGWVEIDIDGITYFFDPEWEMQSKINAYMLPSHPLPIRGDLLAY